MSRTAGHNQSPSAPASSVRTVGMLILCSVILLAATATLVGCGGSASESTDPGQVAGVTLAAGAQDAGPDYVAISADGASEDMNGSGGQPSPTSLPGPSTSSDGSARIVSTASTAPPSTQQSMRPDEYPVTSNSLKGVKGTVVDMDSGEPVAGARVFFGDVGVVSAADGSFELTVSLRVGDKLIAEKDGYISARRKVAAGDGDGWGVSHLQLLSLASDKVPPSAPAG